jgi:SAM-dependent methyltransferase
MKSSIKNILACPFCVAQLNQHENFYQCRSCNLKFPIKQNTVFFSKGNDTIILDGIDYASNKKLWSSFKKRNYSFIEESVKNLSLKSSILDIGSGPGFFDDLFLNHYNYFTLDFVNYPNIDIVSNVVDQRLPIQSSSMDCTILSNVLEHLNKPEKLLLECFRILNNNGSILIIVPFMFKLHQKPYDYYRYTNYKLSEMLNECGFNDIKIKKMGTIKEVLNGIKYEFNQILRTHNKHSILLEQMLRLQYYIDAIINKFFLKLDDEQLTEQDIFTGYSCIATKSKL